MTPSEYWNNTYLENFIFQNAKKEYEEDSYKKQIILFENLGRKLISGISFKPKNYNLITDAFKYLFEEELEEKPQTLEEQIRNLRARG